MMIVAFILLLFLRERISLTDLHVAGDGKPGRLAMKGNGQKMRLVTGSWQEMLRSSF